MGHEAYHKPLERSGAMEGFTRKQIAKILDMPERTINYYTERKVVIPEIDEGQGRGAVRRYSKKNIFELGIVKQLAGYGLAFKVVENIFSLLRFPTLNKDKTKIDRRGIIVQWETLETDTYINLYQTDDGSFKYEMSFGMSVEAALNKDRMKDSGSVLIINIGRIASLAKEQ